MHILVVAVLMIFFVLQARGDDADPWASTPPEIRAWYRGLMQPDNPNISCCGEADAYHADLFEIDGDQYVAIITDERELTGRPHIAPGTRVTVPNHKLKFDRGNPTGHGVIFMNTALTVYCYVVPAGI